MEKIFDFIVENIWAILGALVSGITIIIDIISRKRKNGKINAKEELCSAINQFMKDAETMKNYSGVEKKQYVLTRAIAISKNIMSKEEMDNYIETQIDLTNNVNNNTKKKF